MGHSVGHPGISVTRLTTKTSKDTLWREIKQTPPEITSPEYPKAHRKKSPHHKQLVPSFVKPPHEKILWRQISLVCMSVDGALGHDGFGACAYTGCSGAKSHLNSESQRQKYSIVSVEGVSVT